MATESINVLSITHKHGEEVYANRSLKGTQREILAWVSFNWPYYFSVEEWEDKGEQERIDFYFEHNPDGENYVITTLNLED
jgi:hypothetical protein